MKKLLQTLYLAVALIGVTPAHAEHAPSLMTDVPTCDSEEVREAVQNATLPNGVKIIAMTDIDEIGANANRRDCSATEFTNFGKFKSDYTVQWINKSSGQFYIDFTGHGENQ